MKKTPWFSWKQKPYRVGFYEVRETTGERWFCLWDAYDWHFGSREPAYPPPGCQIPQRNLPDFVHQWRGLEQP